MVYPAITSCRPAPDACRSARTVGAATLTIETSSRAMNWPVSTSASSRPARRTAVSDPAGARTRAGAGTGMDRSVPGVVPLVWVRDVTDRGLTAGCSTAGWSSEVSVMPPTLTGGRYE